MNSEADQVISVERQCRRGVDGKEIGGVSLCIWGPRGAWEPMQRKPRLGNFHLEAEFGLLGISLGVVVYMNKATFPKIQRLLHSGYNQAPV